MLRHITTCVTSQHAAAGQQSDSAGPGNNRVLAERHRVIL